ncbi:MAG: hypothetical protein AAB354_11830 [candidate division KSB1 bacterium]
MITTVAGIYKQGKVELFDLPLGVDESHVLITFLPHALPQTTPRRMVYGQFSGKHVSTEEDYRIAEWRGEAENGNETHH